MPAMPCPHGRYNRSICPHCNGTNDIEQPRIQIEEPTWDKEIAKDDAPPSKTVTTIDI